MNENENLVTEEVTENVEQTTEETPQVKTYTQEEVDAIVGKKKARWEAKIKKDYDRKYGPLTDVLRAGTGKESVEEMTDTFAKFYESKGIKINKTPSYSDKDIEVLAGAEADEIIRGGFDEVIEEADRLKEIGAANMTAKEKAVFRKLTDYVKTAEQRQALESIGVGEDVYNSPEFQSFAGKFNSDTPMKDIYDIYSKTQPKKEIRTMGSMKQSHDGGSGVKDYYTPEEIARMTEEDLDDPRVWEAVRRSMTGR